MRRVLPLLLMACLPTEETFPGQFHDRWCEVADQDCHGAQLLEDCRNLGAPADDVDPQVACDFRQTAAQACLTSAQWSCTEGDDGPEVTVPTACERVYRCDDASTP